MSSKAKKGTIRSRIKRGDEVVFITGREYNRYEKSADGKVERVPYRGKVIAVDPRAGKVKVEGAMIIKKHQKANPQLNVEGGIVKKEAWINSSNVALIDPKTGKPTRVKYEVRDGQKVRVAKSGEAIAEPFKAVKKETKEAELEEIKATDEKETKSEETKVTDEEE
jgi:large subunit ribosomal protein L24